MEIIIKNKRHKWNSNFLSEVNKKNQNKWSKKREDYFCTEVIGGTKCFIKRAEIGFQGAAIFKKLIEINAEGLPKTYGFGEAIENNRKVQYLITEFLNGDTLDVVLNSGQKVNLKTFSINLINSVTFLHSLGYWHSDINGDNIFVSKSGKVFLIDIDSCVDSKVKPTHISNKEGALTTLSNQIGSYALKYYKKHLSKPSSFAFGNLPGVNLNYLQVIILTYQLKYFQDQKIANPSLIWKKSTFMGLNVEDEIRKVNPQYSDSLFKSALIKPLHKEIVNTLTKEIIASSVKTTPDTNKLKKMKELKDLKAEYAQLEQLVSTQTTERSKLITEIATLKRSGNKNMESSIFGWSWFWGIAVSSIAIAVGLFTYNDLNSDNHYLQTSLYSSQSEVRELNNLIDELEKNIEPFHLKNTIFLNSKDYKKGSSFYNYKTTFIAPHLTIYSLKDIEVEVSFKRKKPDYKGYATYNDNVKNQKNSYYIYKIVHLKRGTNEIKFSGFGFEEPGNWDVGSHEFSFYINGKFLTSKTLYIN